MLSCVYCTTLAGSNASVDPHMYLIARGAATHPDEKTYHCSQCGTEWEIVSESGRDHARWRARGVAKSAG